MKDFQIFIPSRSRAKKQKTILNLSQDLWPHITIVCQEDQFYEYRQNVSDKINICPFEGHGIVAKRQFMLSLGLADKIIMMDDDLKFHKRREDGTSFPVMSPAETVPMVELILEYLDTYPMVGLVDYFMAQHTPRPHIECARFNQVLCFNKLLMPDPLPHFRVPGHEDQDMILQLITSGYKTVAITEYSKTEKKFDDGGCSDWRTQESNQEEYKNLADLWPGIFFYEEAPGSTKGYKVRCSWRKAKQMGGFL